MAKKSNTDGVLDEKQNEKRDEFRTPNRDEPNFRLLVKKTTFYACREKLIAASPVFKRMIYADPENPKTHLEFDDKKPDEFLEFLGVMFSIPKKPIDYENVQSMMRFAGEYQSKALEFDCAEFFKKQLGQMEIGDERVFDIILPAASYPMLDIVDRCVPFVAALNEEKFAYGRDSLPLYALAAVLDAKLKRLTSEQHIWKWTSPFKFTKKCTYCELKSKRYCQQCYTGIEHRRKMIRCTGFHDADCRNYVWHNKACHVREVDEATNVTVCLCNVVTCLCGFKEFDRNYLKEASNIR